MTTEAVPSTMYAQVLEKYNAPYVYRDDVPVPEIKAPTDVLIRIKAASFCHTDELLRTGQRAVLPELPFIGCHETAGIIVATGSEVTNVKVGDPVGVPPKGFHSCGNCTECAWTGPFDDEPGYSVYCPSSGEMGLTVPGGFADYVVADSRPLVPIPPSMTPLDTAPLMCAGVTIYAALRRCQLESGKHSVGILGAGGGLGHLGLQFAEKMGLDVVAIEAADGPLDLVKKIASAETMIVDARQTSAAQLKESFKARGVRSNVSQPVEEGLDAVIILPETQQPFDYAMELLKRHGICMLVSVPRAGFHIKPADVIRRDIRILGTQIGSTKMQREMMAFVDEHNVRSRNHVYPFRQLNKLLEDSHHSEGGKYVLDLNLKDEPLTSGLYPKRSGS